MQGLIRKVVAQSQHPHRHTNCHRIFFNTGAHSGFSSLLKPQLQQGNHILTHFQSCRSLSTKLRAFHSFHRFAFNSLPRVSATTLLGCRSTLHFRRHNFNFNHDYDSYRRSWRSWFRRLTPNDMVLGLIIANVAIFLLWRIANEKFMIKNFTTANSIICCEQISLDNFKSGRLHTLITNAFSHVDTWHIVSNMIGLYFFGMNIGRSFGPEFLLKLYLAGAIGGSVFYLMHQAYKAQTSKDWRAMIASKELALGASGAVNAVMLLDIFLFPKATLYLEFFIPVPAVLLGIFLIGKDMLRIIEGDSNISGSAHLGGAAVAAIAWAGVRKGRF
ncbi:RHOMBOID-like protein 12, mitochondrial, partial [Mucuna pruriens]